MGLPRTFVGFSSTDLHYFRLMQAWKAHQHIAFNFADCQLHREIYSETESYIKQVCRERIGLAGTYIMLIGEDTRHKHRYVKWEAEVAIDKGCRLIGVNLNGSRRMDAERCPSVMRDAGAVFTSFNPGIVAYALTNFKKQRLGENYFYPDSVYATAGGV